MYGYVYITENLVNHKKYIGQHQANEFEFDKYIGSGKTFKKALKKYGIENFKTTLLTEIDGVKTVCDSKEELDCAEKFYIAYFSCVESNEYYNIATGGEGGNIGCNIEATVKKAQLKFENLLTQIDQQEFTLFYKTHNTATIRETYNLTVQQYNKLIKYWNLSKTQEEINNIIKNIMLEKYGVENSFQVEAVKEQSKLTKLQRYGNEYYCNKEQADLTRLEKFGCASAFGNADIQQKSLETLIKKYGSLENYRAIQHKLAEQTCAERYGSDYMQTIVARNKTKKHK